MAGGWHTEAYLNTVLALKKLLQIICMPVILLPSSEKKKKSGQSVSYGCIAITLCHIKHMNYWFGGRKGWGKLNWLAYIKKFIPIN